MPRMPMMTDAPKVSRRPETDIEYQRRVQDVFDQGDYRGAVPAVMPEPAEVEVITYPKRHIITRVEDK